MQPSPLDPSLTVKTDPRFSGSALQFTAAKRAVQQRTAVLHFNPSQPQRGSCCCSPAPLPLPPLSLGLQPEKLKVPGPDHHLRQRPNVPSPRFPSSVSTLLHLQSPSLPSITLIRLINPPAAAATGLGERVSQGRSMDHIKGPERHTNPPSVGPER